MVKVKVKGLSLVFRVLPTVYSLQLRLRVKLEDFGLGFCVYGEG